MCSVAARVYVPAQALCADNIWSILHQHTIITEGCLHTQRHSIYTDNRRPTSLFKRVHIAFSGDIREACASACLHVNYVRRARVMFVCSCACHAFFFVLERRSPLNANARARVWRTKGTSNHLEDARRRCRRLCAPAFCDDDDDKVMGGLRMFHDEKRRKRPIMSCLKCIYFISIQMRYVRTARTDEYEWFSKRLRARDRRTLGAPSFLIFSSLRILHIY